MRCETPPINEVKTLGNVVLLDNESSNAWVYVGVWSRQDFRRQKSFVTLKTALPRKLKAPEHGNSIETL